MKNRSNTNWRKHALLGALAVVIVFAAASPAVAQKFKAGDSVECDPTAMNDWLKGTVVDYLEKDVPTIQGNYYLTRVKIDKWIKMYPEGVLCQTDRVRAANAPEVKNPQKGDERTLTTPATPNPPIKPDEAKPIGGAADAQTGAKFKPGDRVECDASGINDWLKGTVLAFKENDNPGLEKDKSGKYFYIHRVRLDKYASTKPDGGLCFTDRTRLLSGVDAAPPPVDNSVGKVTTDADNTLSADREILDCPVEQRKAANGSRPSAELLKKIVRCDKGELPAQKGLDGAVTVDVTALSIGAPRAWSPLADSGDGKRGTAVFPVKVTYTVKTFYRTRTAVEENWIRVINFYVNSFGEWQSGSEEPVKSPQIKDIPRFP